MQTLKNCILENSEGPTPENVTHRIISFDFETCPKSRKFVNVLVHAYYYDSAEFKPDQNKHCWKKYNAHFTFLTTK